MRGDEAPKSKRTHKTRGPALSAREVRFCVGYAETGNATRSFIGAGFPHANENVAHSGAVRLLRKDTIRAYIRRLQTEAMDAGQVTANRIAQGLARIAFANRADLYDTRGRLLPPDQWPPDAAATVEDIDSEEKFEVTSAKGKPKRKELVGHVRKVKTAKRLGALQTLAQWKSMVGSSVPALEVLLNALPPEIAATVRQALAGAVHGGGDQSGTGGG